MNGIEFSKVWSLSQQYWPSTDFELAAQVDKEATSYHDSGLANGRQGLDIKAEMDDDEIWKLILRLK